MRIKCIVGLSTGTSQVPFDWVGVPVSLDINRGVIVSSSSKAKMSVVMKSAFNAEQKTKMIKYVKDMVMRNPVQEELEEITNDWIEFFRSRGFKNRKGSKCQFIIYEPAFYNVQKVLYEFNMVFEFPAHSDYVKKYGVELCKLRIECALEELRMTLAYARGVQDDFEVDDLKNYGNSEAFNRRTGFDQQNMYRFLYNEIIDLVALIHDEKDLIKGDPHEDKDKFYNRSKDVVFAMKKAVRKELLRAGNCYPFYVNEGDEYNWMSRYEEYLEKVPRQVMDYDPETGPIMSPTMSFSEYLETDFEQLHKLWDDMKWLHQFMQKYEIGDKVPLVLFDC